MPYECLTFYKISNLYMEFMNKITETRHNFKYLKQNENVHQNPLNLEMDTSNW